MKNDGRNSAFDRKVKLRLLRGQSVASIAKDLGKGWHTIARSIARLEAIGEIRRIPGTVSPIIYEDAINDDPLIDMLATPENDEETARNSEIHRGAMTTGKNGTVIPQEETLGKIRRASENPQPGKMVGAHISGAFTMQILKAGEMPSVIRDSNGFTIGFWRKEPKKLRHSQYWSGSIRYQGDDIGFAAHQKKDGSFSKLCIYPQRRPVYYKTATVEGPQEMEKQVALVRMVLMGLGWEFSQSGLAGVMHYGDINPYLLQYAGPNMKTEFDGDPVHADCSHGNPEVEIYGNSQTAQDDIILLSELPDRIRAIESSLEGLTRVSSKLVTVNNEVLRASEIQTQAIAKLLESTAQIIPKVEPDSDFMKGYQ